MRLYKAKLSIIRVLRVVEGIILYPLVIFAGWVSNMRNKRLEKTMTYDKAVGLVAKSLARYVVKYGKKSLIIAERVDEDYYNNGFFGGVQYNYTMLKGKKVRFAAQKLLLSDTYVQEDIIKKVRSYKGILVEEGHIEIKPYHKFSEYKKTYTLRYVG